MVHHILIHKPNYSWLLFCTIPRTYQNQIYLYIELHYYKVGHNKQ